MNPLKCNIAAEDCPPRGSLSSGDAMLQQALHRARLVPRTATPWRALNPAVRSVPRATWHSPTQQLALVLLQTAHREICLFVCFVCLFVCLFVCFVCLFVCFFCLFVCLFVCLIDCLFVCLFVCLIVCLKGWLVGLCVLRSASPVCLFV